MCGESLGQAELLVRKAFEEFGDQICVLTSFQREGVVIADLCLKMNPSCRIVTIDTGWLPVATEEMILSVERFFGVQVERLHPKVDEAAAMVAAYGSQLFRESVAKRMLCCEVRKVRPLKSLEASAKAVFVGLRRGQSDVRADVPVFDRQKALVRVSPLADWSIEDVLEYTKARGLPEHRLYAEGYSTIGCDPCTRAVSSFEVDRAGRWWWEDDAEKECGLHFSADGRALRTVDVLLENLLQRTVIN